MINCETGKDAVEHSNNNLVPFWVRHFESTGIKTPLNRECKLPWGDIAKGFEMPNSSVISNIAKIICISERLGSNALFNHVQTLFTPREDVLYRLVL